MICVRDFMDLCRILIEIQHSIGRLIRYETRLIVPEVLAVD